MSRTDACYLSYLAARSHEGISLACAWCGRIVVDHGTEEFRPVICHTCLEGELTHNSSGCS